MVKQEVFVLNKWEVWAWKRPAFGGEFGYELVYAGERFITAARIALREKRAGCGCVKIEWRGEYRA